MSAVAPAHCRSAVLRAVLFSLELSIDFTVQRHKRAAGDAVRLMDTPGQYRPTRSGRKQYRSRVVHLTFWQMFNGRDGQLASLSLGFRN